MRPLVLNLGRGNVGGRRRGGPPYFGTKKLAICGSTSAVKFAPWNDPSWTIASHCCTRPKCGREPDWYFDLHPPSCFTKQGKGWNARYYDWLKHLQTPIFMQKAWPEIPMAVEYPLTRVLSEFRSYFTNHAAYMIALAMTEGVQTIGIFGCEYQSGSEYAIQRGSLEYWLGRFEQSGGRVVLPARESALLNFPRGLYGYESHDAETGKLKGDYKSKTAVTVDTPDGKQTKTLTLAADADCPPLRPLPDYVKRMMEKAEEKKPDAAVGQ